MKHVITSIAAVLVDTRFPDALLQLPVTFPIIPGTGSISFKTSQDGLTREITVTARIKPQASLPEDYISDMSQVQVQYSDEEAGIIKSVTFGSKELPARFTVEDNATTSIKCTYTEVL